MSNLFISVLNLSIAASWLIAAVILVRFLLRGKAPTWISCLLWGLVAVRLVIPFTLESNVSLVPNQQLVIVGEEADIDVGVQDSDLSIDADSAESEAPFVSEDASVLPEYSDDGLTDDASDGSGSDISRTDESVFEGEQSTPIPVGGISDGGDTPQGGDGIGAVGTENKAQSAEPDGRGTAQRGITEKTARVLGTVWLCGCALLLAYACISYLLLKMRVAASVPCGDGVRKSERVESPFVFGLLSPRIYIPFGLSEETESCVIAHERAHMKRMDHLIKPFGFILLSLYWFNPLVWVAYILLCRDIEYACDERVINDLAPEARKRYAMALLECAVSHRRIVACPVAFGETGVKERVKNTMNYKKPAFWLILCGVLICITVAVLFMTTDAADDPDPDAQSSSEISESSASGESSETTSDPSDESADESSEGSESTYKDRDLNYVDGLISVEHATDELIASLGVYDSYGGERDVNVLHTVILPKEDVTEFAIYRIEVSDSWADDRSFEITHTLYTQDKLTNGKPLVAVIEVGDILPENVISFKTSDGTAYYYTITDSPVDRRLLVYRVNIAADEPEDHDDPVEESNGENNNENNENNENGENNENNENSESGGVSQPEVHTHTFGAWVTVNEPDCQRTGLEKRECDCGEAETRTLEKTGHSYVDSVCTVCGASNAPAFVPDYSAGQANTVGGDSGSSQFASQANWIYSADGRLISKLNRSDNSVKSVYRLTSGNVFNLNVVGDWIYFYVSENAAANSYIAKVRTDGSGFEKLLVTGEVWEMLVVKDTIFYTPVKNPYTDYSKDVAPLYSMTVDGKSVKQLHDGSVSSLSADGSYIYFLCRGQYDDAGKIYRMKHNGSNKIELWISDSHGYEVETNRVVLVGSKLYFVDLRNDKYGEGVELASINSNGGGYTSHASLEPSYNDCIFASGSKIYYIGFPCSYGDYSEGYGLVEYNTSSRSFKLVIECSEDAMLFGTAGLAVLWEPDSVKSYDPSSGAIKTLRLK